MAVIEFLFFGELIFIKHIERFSYCPRDRYDSRAFVIPYASLSTIEDPSSINMSIYVLAPP